MLPQITMKSTKESMFDSFRDFLNEEKFTDLRIVCGSGSSSKSRSCHKLIMAGASESLREVLKSTDVSDEESDGLQTMIIPDMDSETLKDILDVVYSNIDNSRKLSSDFQQWLQVLRINIDKEDSGPAELDEQGRGLLSAPDKLTINTELLSSLLAVPSPLEIPATSSPMVIDQDEDTSDLPTKKDQSNPIPSVSCAAENSHEQKQSLNSQDVESFTSRRLPCNQCDFIADDTGSLLLHARSKHSSCEKEFKCDHCSKAFTSETYLQQHMCIQTEAKAHKCPLCPKTFQSVSSLSQHKQTHQGGSWTCQNCDKSFKTKRYLYQHVQKTHRENPEEHKCSICGKTLKRKEDLENHMRIHTGEKPFSCTFCTSSFRFRSSLNTHMKMHANIRKFNCSVCSKSFIQSADLRKHLRAHTNERPYACEICGKTFTRSDYKTKHLRTHQPKVKNITENATAPAPAASQSMMDMEEDLASNVNALLGDTMLTEAAVGLDALAPEEPLQLTLDEPGTSSDWLKIQQSHSSGTTKS